MTPNEFLDKLKSLPPDTNLTPTHLIAVLEMLVKSAPSNEADIDCYPDSKLISEEKLAEWIDESVNTLQKWRVSGKGPKFIKKPKNIAYRVKDVRDWLDNLTVSSTAESHTRLKRFSTEFFMPTPLIFVSTEPYAVPFFDSLSLPEENIIGFTLEHVEYYSAPEENFTAWLYNQIHDRSLVALAHEARAFLDRGLDINKKALRVVGEKIIEFSVADIVSNFKGGDYGYSEFVFMLLDYGLDISNITNPTKIFIKTINAYKLFLELNNTLAK